MGPATPDDVWTARYERARRTFLREGDRELARIALQGLGFSEADAIEEHIWRWKADGMSAARQLN